MNLLVDGKSDQHYTQRSRLSRQESYCEGIRWTDSRQTSAEADYAATYQTKPNQLQGSITYRRKLRRFRGECKVQCCAWRSGSVLV